MFIQACLMTFRHGCHLALTTLSQTRSSGWPQRNTLVGCIEIFGYEESKVHLPNFNLLFGVLKKASKVFVGFLGILVL